MNYIEPQYYNQSTSAWISVARYDLDYAFPTPPESTSEKKLWLNTITQKLGDGAGGLPAVQYGNTMLNNRKDYNSGAGVSPLYMPRLNSLTTQLGGVVSITYGQSHACPANATGSFIRYPYDCFPAWFVNGSSSGWTLWNKWKVTQQSSSDTFAGNDTQTLTYSYSTPVAHGIYRDWSWRFEWWEYTMPTEGTESAFANEDLPTQELGFFQDATGMAFEQMMSSLGPTTGSEEQVFETMNPFHPTKNHFFTPRVQNASGQWVNIPWPSALTLTPLGPDSGLWTFQYQQTGWGFGYTVLLWGTPNASIDLPPLPALPPNQ